MKKKFLIISNGRAGSTWLEGLCGNLPDVTVDYEYKWKPEYPAQDVHRVIPNGDFNIGKDMDKWCKKHTPIVGSKLVLDPICHTKKTYQNIKQTISRDIRVIHLRRRYRDIYLSTLRGFFNILSKDMGQNTENSVLLSALHEMKNNGNTNKRAEKRNINQKDCEQILFYLAKNDSWISSIQSKVTHFMSVDYKDINDRFPEIADFIGSQATNSAIKKIVSDPLTKKLPLIDYEDYVINHQEIENKVKEYEEIISKNDIFSDLWKKRCPVHIGGIIQKINALIMAPVLSILRRK